MSIDFLVKLRDAHQQIADVCNEELEKKRPQKTKTVESYNPENIKWNKAEGNRGPFQAYPKRGVEPEKTADYLNLLADLKQHDGKLTKDGFYYWLFLNNITIGRKKSK